ncbi:carboxylesterase 1C-like [Gigantopelta aegis]|uniref:carboxylesterase 1C-like n=1 Tax=Gigantopelta aegis TaxID=1735272 RepID=UPI001B88C465|nr:carboxylesterase 1C-like [Gigantopelta aegis]
MIWLLCSLAVLTLDVGAQRGPVVTTTLGQIEGRVRRVQNEAVFTFVGIHYAVAPIGRLRFKKPVPRRAWYGVLDATRFGPSCAQRGNTRWLPNRETSEDCLLLNIYVPRTLTPARPRAVMVWIHGGGFVVGQGMGSDGTRLSLVGDVIVVTVNYRLDVFGFIYTGDRESPGNYGLWDQQMAIQFVKDNIASFGGDPNRITIFGESGGGYSVGIHAVIPSSRGLFQRAICESGVGISPRALAFDPISFTRRLSDNLGCTRLDARGQLDTNAFMTCLRTQQTRRILEASARARTPTKLAWRLEIAPVVDGELVPDRPDYLISENNRQYYNPMPTIDFMAGINDAEGGLVRWPLRNFQRNLNFDISQGIPRRVFCDNIAPSIAMDYFNGSQAIAQAICRQYSNESLSDAEQARQVVNMYGDMMFVAPTELSNLIHARNNQNHTTYQYLFTETRGGAQGWFRGANHGAELAYVFGSPRVANRALSVQMMNYWANFAKFGNPNGQRGSVNVQWPAFNVSYKGYIRLGGGVSAQNDLWPGRLQFWLSDIPRLRQGAGLVPRSTTIAPRTPVVPSGSLPNNPGSPQTSGTGSFYWSVSMMITWLAVFYLH